MHLKLLREALLVFQSTLIWGIARRLRETRFKTLTSHGVGFGDARCIVFAHSSIDLAAEAGTLTEEQSAIAENLYWDMRAAGKAMSLDEVKTRIVAGELTGANQQCIRPARSTIVIVDMIACC